jgi:hypothetical protein
MVPVGGGGLASGDLYNDMNSSIPTSTGWLVYENNTTGTGDETLTAYVICAHAGAVTKSSKMASLAAAKQAATATATKSAGKKN